LRVKDGFFFFWLRKKPKIQTGTKNQLVPFNFFPQKGI